MSGPSTPARPAVPAQTPIALPRSRAGKTLVMIDSVAGMMNAPPMPMNARVAMSWSDGRRERRRERAEPEHDQAELQRAAPAEPVAEAAAGEQQAREHERVRVDHPLQLAVRGVEVAHDRRDGDVEDRVVEDDHQQAEAEDREDQPAAFVGVGLRALAQGGLVNLDLRGGAKNTGYRIRTDVLPSSLHGRQGGVDRRRRRGAPAGGARRASGSGPGRGARP